MRSPEKYAQDVLAKNGKELALKIAKECKVSSQGTENAKFWELVLSIISKVK